MLYHALFARYLQDRVADLKPVLIAPAYASFLAELLRVEHWPACSLVTDASAGLKITNELAFWRALWASRGSGLASFTNDIVDHALARTFNLKPFDGGELGNWLYPFREGIGFLSRAGLNRLFNYHADAILNPKHILNRQEYVLNRIGMGSNLAAAYREIWLQAVRPLIRTDSGARLALIFPETAQSSKNLTWEQVRLLVDYLRPDFKVRIFARSSESYLALGVETLGFADRLAPIRQILSASAVMTADTFSAHLSGLSGIPTYVVCNQPQRVLNCQYWGSPYANVFNFEAGTGYQLDEGCRAFKSGENSLCFSAASEASRISDRHPANTERPAVLTGSAARS